jgi:HTH-type transcriptional regulator / antitoxin HigA
MKLKVIKNNKEHSAALARIDALWDAPKGSVQAGELDLWATLVGAYEREQHSIEVADPVEAIRFRMDQMGLKPADLAGVLGGRNRVSEVLNRKRNLSTSMMRGLCIKLGIPAESLLGVASPGVARLREPRARYGVSRRS